MQLVEDRPRPDHLTVRVIDLVALDLHTRGLRYQLTRRIPKPLQYGLRADGLHDPALARRGQRALDRAATRDEPIRQRKQSGSLKQFIIAFVVSYAIGYLVNAMLVWRVSAALELAERVGNAIIPAVLIVISSTAMWILLAVLAVALSQQPKIRRTIQKKSPTTRPTRK